ncbi:argininosuccinate lyase [Pseudomonas gingeri]
MSIAHDNESLLTDARLSAPAAERMVRHHDIPALETEKRQYHEFVEVDLAHTVMLVEQQILSKPVGQAILAELRLIRDLSPADFPFDVKKGSFLLQVESYLFSRIGEDSAGQMHTGRSRIDQGATVRRLYDRKRILAVLDRINEFQVALIEKAARHGDTIMPGYTHMQHAQPWVFGHYLLSFTSRLHDSFSRLTNAYGRVNRNPLGAVGLAGTSWPLDRARTTHLLGFDSLVENSKLGREAWYAAETIGALSFVMADLNDLATDLHIWSSVEFATVESDDGYCGTSSIFPQKKNPSGLETIKKAAGGSVTWLSTALATFRSEGTGDQAMRDLPLIHDALAITEGMLDLFTGIIETLVVHEDRMATLLSGSWCTASNLADVIVREQGISFRQVHHVVARLVRNCLLAGISPAMVTSAALNQAAMETIGSPLEYTDAQVRDALNPRRFVETRVSAGGVGPDEVKRLLSLARDELAQDCEWVATNKLKLASARADLDTAVARIVD